MKNLPIKKTILIIAVASILGVIGYDTKDLIFGAPFSIKTASDGSTLSDSFLPISGTTKHTATVEINGRILAVDKSGVFSDGVVLSPGYNIVEITQKDRFGKEKRKVVHLVAEPKSTVATAMDIHYQ